MSQSDEFLPNQQTSIDECKVCNVTYTDQLSMQEHVFSPGHISRIRSILENGDKVPGYNINTDTQGEEDDNDGGDKRNEQLQQLKNFKTKTSVAIDPANDKLGFYNQFLMQNNMFNNPMSGDKQADEKNEPGRDNLLEMLRIQQSQQQQKNQDIEKNSNGLNENLLLSINADKNTSTSNNNEILQQLYNYGQMSGKLIK